MSRHFTFESSSKNQEGIDVRRRSVEEFADEACSPRQPSQPFRKRRAFSSEQTHQVTIAPLDPFEFPVRDEDGVNSEDGALQRDPRERESPIKDDASADDFSVNATFLIHGNSTDREGPGMMDREEDIARLRLLAGKLSADWRSRDFMAPALARRIRDFAFAQEKRRRAYGEERPWGILGLYDHLAAIRVDVAWAEDAAWRRANGEPYMSWSDFESATKQGIHRPFFTYLLLIVCTILLVASMGLNGWKVEALDLNPMIGPSAETLIRMGAKSSDLIVNAGEGWRLVSSIFLHAGLVHYFINMIALWFVGTAIERTHGILSAVHVFVIPAIGGTILSAIFLPEYITVGASGGIFGLIGACLSDITMNWKLLFSDFVNNDDKKHKHALVVVALVFDIVLNCLIGLTPYVDNFTHLGGMVIGFLCGISTMERLSGDFFGIERTLFMKTKQILIRFFGVIISVIGIIVALIVLFQGDGATTPCPACTWLSCVSFPPWNDYNNRWWYCDDCGLVTANIISNPSPHLVINCPNGTDVSITIGSDYNRDQLEHQLPAYCREFCLMIDA